MRQHIQAVMERTGTVPSRLLDAPALPDGCNGTWAAFLDLHATRRRGMEPEAIGYGDIDAYQRVSGVRLLPWEVRAIRRADNAFFAVRADARQ